MTLMMIRLDSRTEFPEKKQGGFGNEALLANIAASCDFNRRIREPHCGAEIIRTEPAQEFSRDRDDARGLQCPGDG
jgi:hypothetical protein